MKSHQCKKMGIAPTEEVDLNIHFQVTPSERVYFTPIDFVQYAITKCYQLPVKNETYHVTGDRPVSTMMIDHAVCKTLKLALADISAPTNGGTENGKMMERFLGDLYPYFATDVTFSQTNIRKALGDEAMDWPYGQEELEIMMRNYFVDFFPEVEWIQQVVNNR